MTVGSTASFAVENRGPIHRGTRASTFTCRPPHHRHPPSSPTRHGHSERSEESLLQCTLYTYSKPLDGGRLARPTRAAPFMFIAPTTATSAITRSPLFAKNRSIQATLVAWPCWPCERRAGLIALPAASLQSRPPTSISMGCRPMPCLSPRAVFRHQQSHPTKAWRASGHFSFSWAPLHSRVLTLRSR